MKNLSKMILKWIKRYKILILIILVAVFLRSYEAIDRFGYAADGDLFSWIVKDIVDNKHLRLVGQLTSTEGIYIGPLFYYLLVPFYLLAGMDPVGAIFLSIVLSAVTVWSFYFVFKKLFDETSGLIASFLQGVLLARVAHDRWIVPTITTSLWEIWYFFCLIKLLRGEFYVLPYVAILAALIWHISLALLPLLVLIPIAIFLSKKRPEILDILKSLGAFVLFSMPLILFELKHNFIQAKSFISSFSSNLGDTRGVADKFPQVFDQAMSSLTLLLFYPERASGFLTNLGYLIAVFCLALFLVRKGGFKINVVLIFLIWVFSVIGFFTFSSKLISEYYFDNLSMVFLSIIVVSLSILFKSSNIGKIITFFVLVFVLIRSLIYIINISEHNNMGYLERKQVANFITDDSRSRRFPCVSVSYITNPGENVGFRYFFYLNNLHVNQSSSGSPNYTIVIPTSLSPDSIKAFYGAIGVIPPEGEFDEKQVNYSCSGANANLTDPMLLYTE